MKLQMNKYEDKYQTLRLLQSLTQVWGNGMKVNNVRKGSSGAPTPFWNNVCANAYINQKLEPQDCKRAAQGCLISPGRQ